MQLSIGNKMYGLLLSDILPGAFFCGELLVYLYFYGNRENEIKFLLENHQTIFCIGFLLLAIVFGLTIDLFHHIIYKDSKIKFKTTTIIKNQNQIEIYQFFLVNIWYQYEFYANLSIIMIFNLIVLLIHSIEITYDSYIYLIWTICLCLSIYYIFKYSIKNYLKILSDPSKSYANTCIVSSNGLGIIFLISLIYFKEIDVDIYLFLIAFIMFNYFLYIKCSLKEKIIKVNEELNYRFKRHSSNIQLYEPPAKWM